VGILFFVLIAGYISYGYYSEQVKPFHQPVVKINGTVYDMAYYLKLLELYTKGKDATETSTVASNLIDIMKYSEAINVGSQAIGFSVSTDEVNSALKSAGLPDDKVYREALGSTLLAAKLLQDYFDPKVPTGVEQAQVQALLVENEDMAKKVAARLSAGDNFTALVQAYSLEPFTKEKGGDLGWLPKGFASTLPGDLGNSLLKDIPFTLQPGVLSEPIYDEAVNKELGYWLVQVPEKNEKSGSQVKAMLLGSRQEAEEIRARVEKGEDFGALAKEYSQDSETKELSGDLGWTQQGQIDNRVVLAAALPLEAGALSQPVADSSVSTKGGYWLVRVVAKDDNRALDEDTRQTLKTKLFDDWLSEQMKKISVEQYLTDEQKSWALARVLKNRG
jgi:parvulin-like peptidyl-prolyl isomerase